jgi:hypothetical protein
MVNLLRSTVLRHVRRGVGYLIHVRAGIAAPDRSVIVNKRST